MGWYSDPDSMSEAEAEGKARRSGHKEGTLGYMVAYRAAYRPVGDEDGNPYLAYLDGEIDEMKARIRETTLLRGVDGVAKEHPDDVVAMELALSIKNEVPR